MTEQLAILVEQAEATDAQAQSLSSLVQRQDNGDVQYVMEALHNDVPAAGFSLYTCGRHIAVQNALIGKGTLPEHSHEGVEFVHVYRGRAIFHLEGRGPVEVSAYGSIEIPPGVKHSCEVKEDLWCVGVTMPADAGYPSV